MLDEISRTVPVYDNITWAALGEEGKQWPTEALPPTVQRRLTVPRFRSLSTDRDYPYTLVTGQVLFDGGTLMRDRVRYRLPLGALGELIAARAVARDVDAIFAYRREKIRALFGGERRDAGNGRGKVRHRRAAAEASATDTGVQLVA